MHDSLTPLSGLVALFNIMLGEVVFGGVGAGLYGMLAFVVLTVFMAGLMVGRSPEYLGKRIEKREIIMAMIAVLAPCVVILGFSALAVMTDAGRSSITNAGPHGLSQILYAFASMAGNNGSAFAGLSANTLFYNLLGAVAMLVGRFAVIVPMLAIAGSLASKKVCSAILRHVPDRRAAVRRPVGRGRAHRRGVDVFPRTHARPGRRAPADAAGAGVLICSIL